jgi:hypothetical protein
MKILKPGRDQKSWATKVRCSGNGNKGGGCGALLLVSYDDIYKTHSHARDESTTYLTFKCPQCKVETDLNSKIEVPNLENISDKGK